MTSSPSRDRSADGGATMSTFRACCSVSSAARAGLAGQDQSSWCLLVAGGRAVPALLPGGTNAAARQPVSTGRQLGRARCFPHCGGYLRSQTGQASCKAGKICAGPAAATARAQLTRGQGAATLSAAKGRNRYEQTGWYLDAAPRAVRCTVTPQNTAGTLKLARISADEFICGQARLQQWIPGAMREDAVAGRLPPAPPDPEWVKGFPQDLLPF